MWLQHVQSVRAGIRPRAMIATTLACDVNFAQSEVLNWLELHTRIGFQAFFILFDGHDDRAARFLQRIASVKLVRLRGHDARR